MSIKRPLILRHSPLPLPFHLPLRILPFTLASSISCTSAIFLDCFIFVPILTTFDIYSTLSNPLLSISKQFPPLPCLQPPIIPIQTHFIRRLHRLQTNRPPLRKIKHRRRIHHLLPVPLPISLTHPITLNPHPRPPQLPHRRLPRLINPLLPQPPQFRDIPLHKRPFLIPAPAKRHRTIHTIIHSVESRAAQPLPIPHITRRLVVQEPLLEDFQPTFPRNVAPPTSEETGDGVPAEMVNPAFLAELPHEGVDEREACKAVFPPVEPFLFACLGACEARFRNGRAQVPGDEATVGVVECRGEFVAEGGLRAEIHVAEE
ncbi:hypothetical protein ACMFMG_012208 [Clarireedia jacksonii]